MAVRENEIPISSARPIQAKLRTGDPTLEQPMFDWKAQDKFPELNI